MPIIPSIDLIKGNAVQLVGGKEENLRVNAGDPVPIALKFRLAGEIAVVDLDAAFGKGTNQETILRLLKVADCRVGGGIRSVESALYWLNAGATKGRLGMDLANREVVVLGTAATPEVLSALPKNRVVAALDAVEGEVVVKGWTTKTGKSVFERVAELKPYVGGFLVTFVEKEGRMQGFDMEFVKKLVEAVGKEHTLTVAGGVTTAQHIADLDKLGVEAQVGMALYTNTLDLGEAISAPLVSDRPDGLFPTVVADENGRTLGMAFSSVESIKEAVRTQKGVYHSRKRGIWVKGETSGATQELLQISLDCDRDTLCFRVKQHGSGFCHNDTYSCFDGASNKFTQHGIAALARTLEDRKRNPVEKSYTNRLMNDDALLHSKILEEAKELVEAQTKDDIAWEAADVIYFALAKAVSKGVSLLDIERQLQLRSLRVTRRGGEVKVHMDNNNNNLVTTPAPPKPTGLVEVSLKPATASEVYSMELEAIDGETLNKVRNIITDVKTKGMEGLLHYSTLFGDIKTGDSLFYTREELKAIFDQIPQEQQQMLIRTSSRIRAFAQHQRNCLTDLNVGIEGGGGRCGHTVAAVDRAGCYAPGGRFPLPSSVLMTVITARVAGVKTVWVASPRPSQITAAAAYIAGADSLLKIGGAQAIAAFAYGCGDVIPAMDVIVGPGNRWVTAAKQLVSGKVKIDMLAGPSECLVVADESADARLVASDLIAQAEHDPDARPLLISIDDKGLAQQVNQELNSQLKQLPEGNANIASQSINNNGLVVKVSTLEEATSISDKLAAEHLELHVKDSHGAASKFNHYGGLFIGSLAAEVFGDYGAGPNHVLPTGSTARYTGGLSVFTFLRIRTWLQMTEYTPALVQLCQDCHMLAEAEGLYGHAAAAKKRLEVSQSTVPPAPFEITSCLRPDLANLDHYVPVKPLDVLAAEIGIAVESLIKLDANENMYGPHPKVFEAITKAPLHIYPDPSHNHINAAIAKYVGAQQNQIVSGSGSDDILDILIRLVDPHTVIISTPTFGMYSFLGKIAKSKIEDVPTDSDFKVNVSAVLDKVQFHLARNERVIAFFASPNNPTGTLLPNADIEALCSKSNCLVVIDEAYAEFSGTSSIPLVTKYPNLVVVRTFSKWAGLAGLRVGFSVSSPQLSQYMAQIKQPYNVNVAADVAVRTSLEHKDDIMKSVNSLITLKGELFEKLKTYSWLRPVPSQANFILNQVVEGRSAFALWSFLRQRGIFTRFFNTSRLQNYIRISVGRPEDLNKLYSFLNKFHQRDLTSIQADCVLFDMDGVLADVSKSYRLAILETCAHFGALITGEDIVELKAKGNANNDWKVSHQLIIQKIGEDKAPTYEQVVQKFEELYQGTATVKGMWESETLCINEDLLKHLHSKVPLAIVTGRPRKDAIKFLKHFHIDQYFKAVVCMEDAPVKPSPKPVELAMKLLGTKRGVMIGDTPDDIKAAIGAGVVALGIPAPQESGNEKAFLTLQNCGAFKVVRSLDELTQVL